MAITFKTVVSQDSLAELTRERAAGPALAWILGSGFALLAISSCATAEGTDGISPQAEAALEQAGARVLESGSSELLNAAPEYFAAARDLRRCVSPLCGGYFVRAVNRLFTRCADGALAERCYVAEIDWVGFSGQPVDSRGELVLRGRIESKAFPEFGNLGRFVALEGWSSATATASLGPHFRLRDTGLRCITDPCFSLEAQLLNTRFSIPLSDLDLSRVGATDEQLDEAAEALAEKDLISTGRLQITQGTAGLGLALRSTQFYLPFRERCVSDADCSEKERCNAAEVCLPPPGCTGGEPCPSVCTGYCVESSGECASDADCPGGSWCRVTQEGSHSCVPFATEGQHCNGFTLPWAYEVCSPELVCDLPEFVADAPGVCRSPCKSDAECPEAAYCATDQLCHADGNCDRALDCTLPGNTYPHIECVGHPTCPLFPEPGVCGWLCRDPRCLDLHGSDFGPCDAVLGWAVVGGVCREVSGCSAGELKLFRSEAECAAACTH